MGIDSKKAADVRTPSDYQPTTRTTFGYIGGHAKVKMPLNGDQVKFNGSRPIEEIFSNYCREQVKGIISMTGLPPEEITIRLEHEEDR